MRIICITNYYPPSKYGWGYMQLCEEVTSGLHAMGHEVTVLTSTHLQGDEISYPYAVHRRLHLDPDWYCGKSAAERFFVGRRQRERQSVAHLHALVEQFRPDVIFFWHYIGIPRRLLWEAEQLPGVAVVYYLAGYHPELPDEYRAYWEALPMRWTAKLLKGSLARLALHILAREGKPILPKYDHAICVSAYVRDRLVQQGLISPDAVVVYNGVDLQQFSPTPPHLADFSTGGLQCVIAGHIKRDKGVHTVIEALALLRQRPGYDRITLDVVGSGVVDYVDYLQARVTALSLEDCVHFRSAVPRVQMPAILAQYNTLILPSEYDEPLARSMQEGMAIGLLVVGTTTGGSGELLVDGETGLVFAPGDPESLAGQLARALDAPALAFKLAVAGQQEVMAHFNIQRTVVDIASFLEGIVSDKEGHPLA